MKKNISVIYRLAFILFSIWAILESVAFNISALPVKFLNFTVLSDLLCMICILIVLILSFTGKMGRGVYTLKTACTVMALLALAANLSLFMSFSESGWILKVLLPFLMLLDHVLFDENKSLKLWQMFLWLVAALLVAFLLFVIADKLVNNLNSLDLLGLFNNYNEFAKLLFNALILLLIAYLFERLFSGDLFKDIRSTFALIFRMTFLMLEVWALFQLCGVNLKAFITEILYYEILVNFLSFLCVAAILIYNTLKHKANAKSAYVFTNIKAFFTVSMVAVFLFYHFLLRGAAKPDTGSVVLYYIAPAMMLIDWIFIESKSNLRGHEPLIWTAITVCYFIIIFIFSMFKILVLYPISNDSWILYIGIITATMLILGYVFYLTDRFIKRR